MMKDFVVHSKFQKEIQRWLESQKEKKRKRNEKNLNPSEGFCITFKIPEGNLKLAQAVKERKERKKPKKVGFHNMNLYFRGTVPLRKRSNDFSWLQQLHKSQMPLPTLSREKKMTDKEKEERENTIRDFVLQKKEREQLFILKKKKKKKKRIFLGTWSLRKKEKIHMWTFV